MASRELPVLHAVTPDRAAQDPDFAGKLAALQEAGGERLAVHLRLLEATGRRWEQAARRAREGAERTGGWAVVNDRVDVALVAGADAVQLGGRSLPLPEARELLDPEVQLGRSVHSLGEAHRAVRGGANYLLLGTIYATPSHPGREPAGPGLVRACAGAVDAPVVAIGGIDAGRAGEVRAAGAAGMAVQRAVWDAADPARAARELIEAWDRG